MENKIDKFFKDRLDEHAIAPSENAWAKVEAKLSKKNNVIAWRVAAGILLAGALISLIYWSSVKWSVGTQTMVAETKAKVRIDQSQKRDSLTLSEKATTLKGSSVGTQTTVVEKKERSNAGGAKVSEKLPVSPFTVANVIHKEEKNIAKTRVTEPKENSVTSTEEVVALEKLKPKATPPVKIASTKQKPIKLEFTLDDFTSEQPVATVTEEKSTGLKKVLELAREVKNGEGPLKEMKNELFALNFKKNKNH